jgi:hypothetical protein
MAEEIALRDPELSRIATLGKWLALSETGQDTQQAKGASAALRLYYADKLDLPPLAVAELSVIKGRLVVGAKLLRALAARHGYRVIRTDSSNDSCTAVLIIADTGQEIGRSTFTMADAKNAGLVRDRSAWQTHPARMLWARASKFVLDDYAPEVSLGIVTDDEMAEIEDEPYDVQPLGEEEDIEFPPPSSSVGLKVPAGIQTEPASAGNPTP